MWTSKKCSGNSNDNVIYNYNNNGKLTIMGEWIVLILITAMIGGYLLKEEI